MQRCGAGASICFLIILTCLGSQVTSRTVLQTAGTGTGSGSGAGTGTGPVTATSCASARASATWGSANAFSRGQSAAIQASGSACATAFSQAMATICGGGNAYTAIFASAEVCATAMAKVLVSASSSSSTTGSASACGNSCAAADATAKAIATAMADAYATAQGSCTEVASYLRSDAFAKACAYAYGDAWSVACSKRSPTTPHIRGSGASAEARAVVTATAVGLAKAFGDAAHRTCQCSSCHCSADVQKDAQSLSETNSVAVGGLYALTQAVGDAGAIACTGKNGGQEVAQYSQAAASLYLDAFAETCLKLYGSYYLNVHAGKWSTACAGVTITGGAWTETVTKVTAEAWANNFDYCTDVYSYVQGSVLVSNAVETVVNIIKGVCVAKGGAAVQYDEVKVLITGHKPFADAAAMAFGQAFNNCPCSVPFQCCSTCNWSVTCPAYKQ